MNLYHLPSVIARFRPTHLLYARKSGMVALARVASLNVGRPKLIQTANREVRTGFFKTPVSGRVPVRGHQIDGDQQADLRVHGGPYKAVYAYPSEHYPYWQTELGIPNLSPGSFGENLTIEGLTEETTVIGDQFRIGSAILQVSQPRMPCFKLALRFERSDMVKKFWASGRSGFYFSVVQEGDMAAGDPIEKIADGPQNVTIADVLRLYRGDEWGDEVRQRALASPLRGSWKQVIQQRLTETVPLSD